MNRFVAAASVGAFVAYWVNALLTDRQKELEKAMQQREHNGEENWLPARPAADPSLTIS